MKRIAFVFTVLFVAGVAVYSAVAQPPGGGPGPGGQRGGRGQGGPDGFRPPPHPLEEALDTDGDHQLSAEELENAVASLKKLDKNEDGKLSDDELRRASADVPVTAMVLVAARVPPVAAMVPVDPRAEALVATLLLEMVIALQTTKRCWLVC